MRRADFQKHAVLDRFEAMHRPRWDMDKRARQPIELLLTERKRHMAGEQIERLLLDGVFLQAEALARGYFEHLTGILVMIGVPDLASPRFLHNFRCRKRFHPSPLRSNP